ncbi:MAG: hypothetical protein HY297_05650 [Thaumarchaeota archaeon]|nr:hypothetical protein [Nitrososphaerota archaeon]
MYDFETLVGELLQNRPELTREELLRRIEDKKQKVGAGYLTDQGALFLVAGELGVSLRKDEGTSDLTLKDLYIGANDVTVVARVLAVYPTATYNKKDGGTGKYRRLVLFDGNQTVRMTLWEEGAEEVEKRGIATDVPVRIVSGYVKQGLDGKPSLNLGRRGKIEVVSDEKVSAKLVPLSSVTEKLPNLSQEKQFVAFECRVTSEPRFSEFVRADGSSGSLFQFGAAGEGGKGEVRGVVWSPSARPELRKGQKLVITNVKARRSSSGEFEVHGDAGSSMTLKQPEKTMLRVATAVDGQTKVLLALDKTGRVVEVQVGEGVESRRAGDVIAVMPNGESEGKVYCSDPDSLKLAKDDSFPGLEDLATKLRDVKDEGHKIMVEVIALSQGSVDEVQLKDGSTVKKGELVVGDDTGEMKLVAWRELSGKVTGVQPGERLRFVGVTPKPMKMGGRVLEASYVTVVERLRGRA